MLLRIPQVADPLDLRQPVSAQPQRFQARVRFQVLNFTIALVLCVGESAKESRKLIGIVRTTLRYVYVDQENIISALA